MQRRTFLTTVAALGTAATAGCVGGGAGDDSTDTETGADGTGTDASDSPTETSPSDSPSPSPTGETPSVAEQSLEPRKQCAAPGGATIAVDGSTVTVDGCIVGRNGCQVPALGSVEYDASADELTVTVLTRNRSDTDACTQALVHLGYAVTVEFDGGAPGTVAVVHDGAKGRRQVARTAGTEGGSTATATGTGTASTESGTTATETGATPTGTATDGN